jgi:hypothetical protein
MDSPSTTATTPVTIAGEEFLAPRKYAAGHVLSAAEAQALNTALWDNLRANFSKRVKDQREAVQTAAMASGNGWASAWQQELSRLREEFAAYAAGYAFASGPGKGDAQGRMAKQLAESLVRTQLNGQGKRPGDLPEGEFDRRVAAAMQMPALRAEAERRLAALSALAEEALT